MAQVVSQVADEITGRGLRRVLLWGHSSGTAFALATASELARYWWRRRHCGLGPAPEGGIFRGQAESAAAWRVASCRPPSAFRSVRLASITESGRVTTVIVLDILHRQVTGVRIIVNPDKLSRLQTALT